MNAVMGIGLVGCGRLAERGYVPALRRADGVRLAAVADSAPARCAAAAPGMPAYASCAELLAGSGVDALVLATPAVAHLHDARLGAEAGLPVLVEKPPAPDASAAAALAALEPQPFVGFNRRFDPGRGELRAALANAGSLDLRLELRYRWRSWGAYAVADDALLDLGPHLIDLARWLSRSEVAGVRVESVGARSARFELELERGGARIALGSDGAHRERVEVRDADGRTVAEDATGGLVRGLLARLPGRAAEHPLVPSLTAQLESFARRARGGREPALGTAADGLAAMRVVDAVRSAAPGCRVRLGAMEPAC